MVEALTKSFEKITEDRHEYAREWKRKTGGKVIGCLCTWVPEELIMAAGALPVRIMKGNETTDVVAKHIPGRYCALCRDALGQGLSGKFDYLDGIVHANGCYHIRHTFFSWKAHVPTPFSHYLFVPTNTWSRGAQPQLVRELRNFKKALEGFTGREITEEDLRNATEKLNANRRLMRQIYETRRSPSPPVSGTEAMLMVRAGMVMDKDEHSSMVHDMLQAIPGRPPRGEPVRLMLVGSEVDDPSVFRLVEAVGGDVVIDENCVGTRYFWNEVQQEGDIVDAIANRYLNKPLCPVYDYGEERRRLPFILNMAREYRVQGVILVHAQFCDSHEYDLPVIERALKQEGIPTLLLNLDATTAVGQLRTRVEALIETVGLEV